MTHQTYLAQLILVHKVDASIAQILAERKKLTDEIALKNSLAKTKQEEAKTHRDLLEAKRRSYIAEEKRIKGEQQKLVDRRKALATLSNYKLQQSAQTEIELASKDIVAQEDGLISMLVAVEDLEKRVVKIEEEAKKLSAEAEEIAKTSTESFTALETRQKEKVIEREQLAQGVDKEMLKGYDRIRSKYPMDALAPVRAGNCTGCHIHLGQQSELQIMRGTALVKCRGCGRILYLENAPQ